MTLPLRTNRIAGYRWIRLWIVLGLGLAILLLVNSVSTYRMVSRRLVVDHQRRNLSEVAASLDLRIQSGGPYSQYEMTASLQQALQNSGGRIAWIQLRNAAGSVVAHAGLEMPAAFSAEYVRSQARSRKPTFKTVQTNSGPVVIEAFPFRIPASIGPTVFRMVADARPPRQFGVIEIAGYLNSAGGSLWPLQRNLMISASAALALLVSLTAIAIRFRAYIDGRHLEHEVRLARRVQRDLLPSADRVSDHFELAAHCVPATCVGGDFYDAFAAPANRDALVLGDVSGKGVPAALLMSVIHGAVRASSWTGSASHHENATRQLNSLLCERAAPQRFATMFWSYFDPQSQLLRYINAGHCPPLLFMTGRKTGPLRLREGGPVLGLLPGATFQQDAVLVEPDDVLILYSDGIVEAVNSRDEQFGEERLIAVAESCIDRTATEIRDLILSSLQAFTGRALPDDDRTLLVVRYSEKAAPWNAEQQIEQVILT